MNMPLFCCSMRVVVVMVLHCAFFPSAPTLTSTPTAAGTASVSQTVSDTVTAVLTATSSATSSVAAGVLLCGRDCGVAEGLRCYTLTLFFRSGLGLRRPLSGGGA